MSAKAFSYARWSSKGQRDGHSLARQLSAATAYADENGLDLDTSMVDDAVSAYRGDNRLKGELSRFKARIDAGEIPVGSYFLIDSYDRFSREEATVSVQSLLEIVNAGVNVVTLSNKAVFTKGSDNATSNLMFAVMDLDRANRESVEKGRKIKKAHDDAKVRARQHKLPYTPIAPTWLDFDKQGMGVNKVITFTPIPERVALIQEIFDLYEGGVSSSAVARMLNDRGELTHYQFWRFRNPIKLNGEPVKRADRGEWTADAVFTLVSNRAVLGEFQPHVMDRSSPRGRRIDGPPITGYFGEPIIDEAQFFRVQALVEKRRKAPRQNSTKAFRNLFSGIGKCGTCGGTFSLHNTAKYDNRNRNARLRCVSASQGGKCDNKMRLLYATFEEAFLQHVTDLPLPKSRASADPVAAELADAILKRDDLKQQCEAMAINPKLMANAFFQDALFKLTDEFVEYEARVKALQSKVGQVRAERSPVDHQATIARLRDRLEAAEGDELFALRAAISTAIGKIVSQIRFYPSGAVAIHIQQGHGIYDEVGKFFPFPLPTGVELLADPWWKEQTSEAA
jgi:DNA invertase Pin-like site-specific DNA recombinase